MGGWFVIGKLVSGAGIVRRLRVSEIIYAARLQSILGL